MSTPIRPDYYPKLNGGGNPQPTNTSYTFPIIDCTQLRNVRIHITADNTSTPVMTFKVQGSESPTAHQDMTDGGTRAHWVDMTLPAGSVHGTSTDLTFSAPAVNVSWAGGSALNFMIDMADVPSYIRLVATRTGGGSATPSLQARFNGRIR